MTPAPDAVSCMAQQILSPHPTRLSAGIFMSAVGGSDEFAMMAVLCLSLADGIVMIMIPLCAEQNSLNYIVSEKDSGS